MPASVQICMVSGQNCFSDSMPCAGFLNQVRENLAPQKLGTLLIIEQHSQYINICVKARSRGASCLCNRAAGLHAVP